jgi:hypothetical protein
MALSTTYELNINNHTKTDRMERVVFKVGYLQSWGFLLLKPLTAPQLTSAINCMLVTITTFTNGACSHGHPSDPAPKEKTGTTISS